MSSDLKNALISKLLNYSEIAQPNLFLTFLKHLVSLGIVEYTNTERLEDETLKDFGNCMAPRIFFCVKLTMFGRLFFNACVAGTCNIGALAEIRQ